MYRVRALALACLLACSSTAIAQISIPGPVPTGEWMVRISDYVDPGSSANCQAVVYSKGSISTFSGTRRGMFGPFPNNLEAEAALAKTGWKRKGNRWDDGGSVWLARMGDERWVCGFPPT